MNDNPPLNLGAQRAWAAAYNRVRDRRMKAGTWSADNPILRQSFKANQKQKARRRGH